MTNKKNDKVDGLKGKVTIVDGKRKIVFSYKGQYGLGYDGCGSHSHGFARPTSL